MICVLYSRTGMSTLTWSYAERIDSPAECIFSASGSNLIQIQVDSLSQAMAAIATARKRIIPSYPSTASVTASTPPTNSSVATNASISAGCTHR